jgi:hypothetical protein
MFTLELEKSHQWSTLQESRIASSFPNAYLRLLSALDTGWEIIGHELKPTWDQNGIVYQVVIRQPFTSYTEVIIMPRSTFVDEILEHSGIVC